VRQALGAREHSRGRHSFRLNRTRLSQGAFVINDSRPPSVRKRWSKIATAVISRSQGAGTARRQEKLVALSFE
jgi:hypothetical protein